MYFYYVKKRQVHNTCLFFYFIQLIHTCSFSVFLFLKILYNLNELLLFLVNLLFSYLIPSICNLLLPTIIRNHLNQHLRFQRLRQMFIHSCFQYLSSIFRKCIRCHRNDWNISGIFLIAPSDISCCF